MSISKRSLRRYIDACVRDSLKRYSKINVKDSIDYDKVQRVVNNAGSSILKYLMTNEVGKIVRNDLKIANELFREKDPRGANSLGIAINLIDKYSDDPKVNKVGNTLKVVYRYVKNGNNNKKFLNIFDY